jgi:hypothetical protein
MYVFLRESISSTIMELECTDMGEGRDQQEGRVNRDSMGEG